MQERQARPPEALTRYRDKTPEWRRELTSAATAARLRKGLPALLDKIEAHAHLLTDAQRERLLAALARNG